jgi:hypothetical protein
MYSSPITITMIKSRRMRATGYVAYMGKSRNTYRVLVGKSQGKRPPERRRRGWDDNIQMDLREIEWAGMDWVHLALDTDYRRNIMNVATSIRFP